MIIAVAVGCFCVGLVAGIGLLLWAASEPKRPVENEFQRYKRHLENRKFYEPRDELRGRVVMAAAFPESSENKAP